MWLRRVRLRRVRLRRARAGRLRVREFARRALLRRDVLKVLLLLLLLRVRRGLLKSASSAGRESGQQVDGRSLMRIPKVAALRHRSVVARLLLGRPPPALLVEREKRPVDAHFIVGDAPARLLVIHASAVLWLLLLERACHAAELHAVWAAMARRDGARTQAGYRRGRRAAVVK